MSLINRLSVTNFMNSNGESEHSPWVPRFRMSEIVFYGQSTAINARNGCGKTSLARAMLAILSRNQFLVTETHKRMSPKSFKIPSHIKVELIKQPDHMPGQTDMLVKNGNKVGGATYVFGMTGFRNDDISYYYYQGSLEDCPTAMFDGEKHTLLAPDSFDGFRKSIPSFKWCRSKDEWEKILSMHVSIPAMKKMADFQRRGSSDKGISFFNIKVPSSERFDQSFFYDIIAPEIMSGTMDRYGEEDEDKIEKVIFNTVSRVIAAKKNTESQRANLEKAKSSQNILANAAMYAEQSKIDLKKYQDKLAEIAGVALFLDTLVTKQPLLGIPSTELPEGIAGDVAKHLIVGVGETELMILASGLSVILGIEPMDIRRKADRNNINGRKISETVGNPCHNPFLKGKDDGPKPMSYTIADAHKIISATTKFSTGINNATAHDILNEANDWYEGKGERNPYRKRVARLEQRKTAIALDIKETEGEIRDINEQERELNNAQRQMSANEGAFDKLRQCGLFTAEELENPYQSSEKIDQEYCSVQNELSTFRNKRTSLSQLKPDWERFIEKFGDRLSPHEVEGKKKAEKKELIDSLERMKRELGLLKDKKDKTQRDFQELRLEKTRIEGKISHFEELLPGLSHYERLFEDLDPDDLDTELLREKEACAGRRKWLKKEISRLSEDVGYISTFEKRFGTDISPASYITQLNDERDVLTQNKLNISRDLTTHKRKRRELEKEQIAAGDAAREALDLLEKNNIEHLPLYKVIQSIKMPTTRRKEILSMFSALLFTPVIATETDGASAAKAMSDVNLPVPIILKPSLEIFCKKTESSDVENLFVGTITRAVECLLDPSLVEREKDNLDGIIKGLKAKIEVFEERLVEISSESELVKSIRKAALAIENNATGKLASNESEYKSKKERIEELEPLTTKESIEWIRKAQTIKALGGIHAYELLKEKEQRIEENSKKVSTDLTTLDDNISDKENAIEKLSCNEHTILLPEDITILANAKKYCDDGGIEFSQTEIKESIRLEHLRSNSDNRKEYKIYFQDAQTFLDSRNVNDGETIQDKLEVVRGYLDDAGAELNRFKDEADEIQRLIPDTIKMIETIDRGVFNLLSKYRQMVVFTNDIDTAQSIPSELQSEITIAKSLLNINIDDIERVRHAFHVISDSLTGIDVDTEIKGLNVSKRQLDDSETKMKENLTKTIESEGLATTEKEMLISVKDIRQAQSVIDLNLTLKKICEDEESKLSEFETKEKEHRSTTSERITYFIQSASTNLSLFKRMSKKDYGPLKAHFIIEADMIDEETSAGLVEDIVDIFEEEEGSRRRTNSKGLTLISDSDFRTGLEAQVKEMIYRRIFTSPSIKYEMEAIIATGQHYLSETLSEGEKSAMTLMWAIRIADFTIEKGARSATRTLSARAKARDNAESIMILDGLFSDLSFTDLIKSAMAGIENTRGNFQLIGLIHGQHYDNDFSIFPMLVLGKTNQSSGTGNGWVSFENRDESGTVDFANIHSIKGNLNQAATV